MPHFTARLRQKKNWNTNLNINNQTSVSSVYKSTTFETDITNGIQRCVGAEGEVCSRNIIANVRWYHRHWDAEFRMFFSGFGHHQ